MRPRGCDAEPGLDAFQLAKETIEAGIRPLSLVDVQSLASACSVRMDILAVLLLGPDPEAPWVKAACRDEDFNQALAMSQAALEHATGKEQTK